MIEAFDNYMHL